MEKQVSVARLIELTSGNIQGVIFSLEPNGKPTVPKYEIARTSDVSIGKPLYIIARPCSGGCPKSFAVTELVYFDDESDKGEE